MPTFQRGFALTWLGHNTFKLVTRGARTVLLDPWVEGNPACPTEMCGNCLDDDGDGLIDYEDADCCDDTANLGLRKMSVRNTLKQVASSVIFMP